MHRDGGETVEGIWLVAEQRDDDDHDDAKDSGTEANAPQPDSGAKEQKADSKTQNKTMSASGQESPDDIMWQCFSHRRSRRVCSTLDPWQALLYNDTLYPATAPLYLIKIGVQSCQVVFRVREDGDDRQQLFRIRCRNGYFAAGVRSQVLEADAIAIDLPTTRKEREPFQCWFDEEELCVSKRPQLRYMGGLCGIGFGTFEPSTGAYEQ